MGTVAAGARRPPLHLLPVGIDTSRFVPAHRQRPARPGPLRLLCVARLAAVKGHATLLEAFARRVNGGHDVTRDLVGDGTLRDTLAAHVDRLGLQSRVRLLGVVSNHRLPSVYAQADVFGLASRAEGCRGR